MGDSAVQAQYILNLDSEGCLHIPAEVLADLGVEPKPTMIVSRDVAGIHIEPAPKRRIRIIPPEEIAQALVDGAITPEGMQDAIEGIRRLGLSPADFKSQF